MDDLSSECEPSNFLMLNSNAIYTTIVSSIFSIIGSCLIIISFAVWSDLRTTARAILVFLAIADLFTAIGYLFASILFLTNYLSVHNVFTPLCTFQSFITTAFPISSFLWTANLAVYLFVSITLKKVKTAKKLMLFFHLIAWGIPLVLCIPGASTMVLGGQNETQDQSQGTVGWCWVSFDGSFQNDTRDAEQQLAKLHALELVFGKFWEILAGVTAFVLCVIVKISVHKKVSCELILYHCCLYIVFFLQKKQVYLESQQNSTYNGVHTKRVQAVLNQLDQKLLWIPIFFILFRIWGTLRWLVSSTYPECTTIDFNCSVQHKEIWFKEDCVNIIYNPFLVYMQAIGDPGQGWGNALLYGLFHATIFKRLCPCLFICWKRLTRYCKAFRIRRDYDRINDSKADRKTLSVSSHEPTTGVEVTTSNKSVIFYTVSKSEDGPVNIRT